MSAGRRRHRTSPHCRRDACRLGIPPPAPDSVSSVSPPAAVSNPWPRGSAALPGVGTRCSASDFMKLGVRANGRGGRGRGGDRRSAIGRRTARRRQVATLHIVWHRQRRARALYPAGGARGLRLVPERTASTRMAMLRPTQASQVLHQEPWWALKAETCLMQLISLA